MADIKELITKYEAFVKRLEGEGHEVTVGDTKTNTALAIAFRSYSDSSKEENDDVPVRSIQQVQKLMAKAGEHISRAYQS